MRKRIKTRCAVKVLSCINGKIIRYACMALCLIAMSSCKSNNATMGEQSDSWSVYCSKYHVDPVNPTEEQENFYMDCYMGSVEEELDMRGVAHFRFDSYNVHNVIKGVLLPNTYYVVYEDSVMNMEYECIKVDIETADMIKTAIMSPYGHLSGYLVLDKTNGVYNYNHEIR